MYFVFLPNHNSFVSEVTVKQNGGTAVTPDESSCAMYKMLLTLINTCTLKVLTKTMIFGLNVFQNQNIFGHVFLPEIMRNWYTRPSVAAETSNRDDAAFSVAIGSQLNANIIIVITDEIAISAVFFCDSIHCLQ